MDTDYFDYKDLYYGWYQDTGAEGIIPAPTPGGDTPTREEMEQAIQNALDSIDMVRVDEDTMVLKVGDRESAPIDDVYVTGVEKTDEPDGTFVNIKRNNGKGDLKVSLDEFEDTKIDGEYF